MEHFVYILLSLKDGSYYKGYSLNPFERSLQHNNGQSSYTKAKTPWKLIHVEKYDDKTSALRREKAIKKYSHSQIESLVTSERNIIRTFDQIR